MTQSNPVANIEKLTGEQLEIFEIAYNAAKLSLEQKYLVDYPDIRDIDPNTRREISACARGIALNVSLLYMIDDLTLGSKPKGKI